MGFVVFLDENLYRRRELALKRYFQKCYNYLIFEVFSKLKEKGKIDGIYQIELPTEKLFEKVYGKMILKFTVKNDLAIIEDIIPNEILDACYERNLPLYKGIPYDKKSDLVKLKIMEELLK